MVLFNFSFDNQMYKQIDGISMGSPLGPIISNIFVGFYDILLSEQSPLYYKRYVDDTSAVFTGETNKKLFLTKLHKLHHNLEFTMENSVDNKLHFLDVLVHFESVTFSTSVFRKIYFTGDYILYNSYSPMQQKVNLIICLTYRAL